MITTFLIKGGLADGKLTPHLKVDSNGTPPKWLHVTPTVSTDTGDGLEALQIALDKGVAVYRRHRVNPPSGPSYWQYVLHE